MPQNYSRQIYSGLEHLEPLPAKIACSLQSSNPKHTFERVKQVAAKPACYKQGSAELRPRKTAHRVQIRKCLWKNKTARGMQIRKCL